MNLGSALRLGSTLMNMSQDPKIHMLVRGAWGGMTRLRKIMVKKKSSPNDDQSRASGTTKTSRTADVHRTRHPRVMSARTVHRTRRLQGAPMSDSVPRRRATTSHNKPGSKRKYKTQSLQER